ncbi:MAG: hypothetical protein JW963_25890 [Anaerolineales bacterium]|nr:hypothetical protein [Anaerolineales bacterium]
MTTLAWIVIGFTLATSAGLIIIRDWRLELGLLGLQYVGVFWLANQYWPISMAAIKLVTGWMAIAILGITRLNLKDVDDDSEQFWPQGRLFRIFAAGIVTLIVVTASPRVEVIIPGIGLPVIYSSLILIGLGMLHLGMTAQPFRVILGLLTVLSGFEALYAALESSILVAAMLSTVNLGMALVGAYLLSARTLEENE